MYEHVGSALAGQEPETLGLIEPLHRTFDHERAPPPSATSPPALTIEAVHHRTASFRTPVERQLERENTSKPRLALSRGGGVFHRAPGGWIAGRRSRVVRG